MCTETKIKISITISANSVKSCFRLIVEEIFGGGQNILIELLPLKKKHIQMGGSNI